MPPKRQLWRSSEWGKRNMPQLRPRPKPSFEPTTKKEGGGGQVAEKEEEEDKQWKKEEE